jgi:hypothetical protein
MSDVNAATPLINSFLDPEMGSSQTTSSIFPCVKLKTREWPGDEASSQYTALDPDKL